MAKAQNQQTQPNRTARKPISRPSLQQTVVLNTPCAQRVYNRVYTEVSRNLYSLGVVTHVMSPDEKVAEELDNIVKERFAALKQQMDEEVKRLEVVRDDAGVSALPSYTEPQSIEPDVTSPMTFHFIRLLETLDKVVTLLDSLWLTEEIDVKQKLRLEYMWQKRLIKFSNQLRELNNRARKASRRAVTEDAETEEGHAEAEAVTTKETITAEVSLSDEATEEVAEAVAATV